MRVLLADDTTGHGLALCLAAEGLSVHTVTSLRDALAALRGVTPDAVVLDLRLGDGVEPDEVASSVRLAYRGTIVVASGLDGAAEIAARIGALYLPKPFDPAALAALLRGSP